MVYLQAGMFELVVCVVHGDLDSKHCSNIHYAQSALWYLHLVYNLLYNDVIVGDK